MLQLRSTVETSIASRKDLYAERSHVPRQDTRRNGVECIEVGEPDAPVTLMYLHGGGFTLGHPRRWDRYAARIADEANVRVVMVRYRLATENPLPAGLHDVVTVFESLREEHPGRPIVVMGESAGANLTASLLVAAEISGQPFPDAAIIISPPMNFGLTSRTFDSHADVDPWVSRESAERIRDNHLQGHSPADPLASPIHADMSSYPPILLCCGGREVLLGDTLAFAEKLALANRNVELQLVADAEHGWSFTDPNSAAAQLTIDRVVHFLKWIIEKSRPQS